MEGVIDLDLLEDVKGFEGLYQINRKGQVWSVKKQIFLKPYLTITIKGQGNVKEAKYYSVGLQKEKKHIRYYIHRLLALQFIPNPLGLPQVDHIDINCLNNCLDNLRWVDRRTNMNNRNVKSKSGERYIYIRGNCFQFDIQSNKKRLNRKSFKTLEEAKTYRDTFLRENNLN